MSRRSFSTYIAALLLSATASFAHADGRIIQVDFSGPDDPSHPNVLQITIEGGFSVAGCDSTYAAIRSDASRRHLIDFALASYASGQSVKVVLNPSDKYFPSPNAPNGRCAISRISNH
jgi:hypothetical protein